jgi:hypothetical protein
VSPLVHPASNAVACAANSWDCIVSSCGITATPGHDPFVVGISVTPQVFGFHVCTCILSA